MKATTDQLIEKVLAGEKPSVVVKSYLKEDKSFSPSIFKLHNVPSYIGSYIKSFNNYKKNNDNEYYARNDNGDELRVGGEWSAQYNAFVVYIVDGVIGGKKVRFSSM